MNSADTRTGRPLVGPSASSPSARPAQLATDTPRPARHYYYHSRLGFVYVPPGNLIIISRRPRPFSLRGADHKTERPALGADLELNLGRRKSSATLGDTGRREPIWQSPRQCHLKSPPSRPLHVHHQEPAAGPHLSRPLQIARPKLKLVGPLEPASRCAQRQPLVRRSTGWERKQTIEWLVPGHAHRLLAGAVIRANGQVGVGVGVGLEVEVEVG